MDTTMDIPKSAIIISSLSNFIYVFEKNIEYPAIIRTREE